MNIPGGRGRLAIGAAVLLCILLLAAGGIVFDRELHRALEEQASELDLTLLARQTGLGGRVDPPRWAASRLDWSPRPRLVLSALQTRIHSGLPGPGESAGELLFDEVRIVPAWDFLWSGRLALVEVVGGEIRVGRDLLPEPPRRYVDPVDGTHRPVPWAAFLEAAQAPALPRAEPGASIDMESARDAAGSESPIVAASRLDLSLPGFELVPDRHLSVDRAELRIRSRQVDLAGWMRIADREGRGWTIPFSLRHDRPSGGPSSLEVRFGPRGAGVRVVVRGAGSPAPTWNISLEDPEGRVAAALLEGRAGVLRRLRWAGPWRMEVQGDGAFPDGIQGAEVELLSGRFRLEGDSLPVAIVRGRVSLLPGRIDLDGLTLRSPLVAADSAALQLSWLRTPERRTISGRLRGRIDPAWLALFGEEWKASGRLACDLAFDGKLAGESREWSLKPRGTCRGEDLRLAGPWFADTLRGGGLEAWAHPGGLGFVVAGVWGGSPFRLEARDLPLPGPGYLDLVAAGGCWNLRSDACRLEDFRLAPARFPEEHAAPFWLGLPGRGEIRIGSGSFGGVPFENLRLSVHRSRGTTRVDTLEVEVAGGTIRNEDLEPAGLAGARGAFETRLRADSVDFSALQQALEAGGLRLPGEIRGRLHGTFRLRWPRAGESLDRTQLDASVRIESGSLRGLPPQQALVRASGLAELGSISFRELRADLRREPGRIAWNRLRIEAPPLALEGAGRLTAPDWLEAAFVLRLSERGASEKWAETLSRLFGREQTTLYLGLRGAAADPAASILSRAEFLRELDAMRGSLLPGSHSGSIAR